MVLVVIKCRALYVSCFVFLSFCFLAQVWEVLSGVWKSISELEETPWSTAVPRRIRKSLDSVQETMRNFPNRVRQYEPFDHAQVIRVLQLYAFNLLCKVMTM